MMGNILIQIVNSHLINLNKAWGGYKNMDYKGLSYRVWDLARTLEHELLGHAVQPLEGINPQSSGQGEPIEIDDNQQFKW